MTASTPSKAFDGLINLDGDSLRRLTSDDLPAVLRLREAAPGEMFHLPVGAAELAAFMDYLANRRWSMPMLCCHEGKPSGLCLMSMGQLKNLNSYLVPLFEQPATAERMLALYLRQAFWAFPLHRLYTQLPKTLEVEPHIDLLRRCGFKDEGRLVGHLEIKGRPVDVAVFGLLRGEFDAWCATNDPRLSLA
jgi:hypothetical protein